MHSYIHCFSVMSKLSLIDTHFEPDNSRMNMRNFVSCAAGFGIREVFCAACPPHHYSPDKSIECLKCVKGFHQPVAGSEKCVRCRNIFASGCYMVGTYNYIALGIPTEYPPLNNYVLTKIFILMHLIIKNIIFN